MTEHPYEFQAPVELLDFGRFAYSVVYLPEELCQRLPLDESPRLRIEGDVCGFGIQAAIQPTSAGERYLMLSKRVLKGAQLDVGDQAIVRFSIADQDAVDVPIALQHALEANEVAAAAWSRLTPGKRRGLVVPIHNAKTEPTRHKRIEELIDRLARQ